MYFCVFFGCGTLLLVRELQHFLHSLGCPAGRGLSFVCLYLYLKPYINSGTAVAVLNLLVLIPWVFLFFCLQFFFCFSQCLCYHTFFDFPIGFARPKCGVCVIPYPFYIVLFIYLVFFFSRTLTMKYGRDNTNAHNIAVIINAVIIAE